MRTKWMVFLLSLTLTSFAQTYKFSTLVNFSSQGMGPTYPSTLIIESQGNLYGTSSSGGTYGFGTVFKVTPKRMVMVLHSFAGAPKDGAFPNAGLVRDQAGNLYGTTSMRHS